MIARWDEDRVGTRGDKGKVNCNSYTITPSNSNKNYNLIYKWSPIPLSARMMNKKERNPSSFLKLFMLSAMCVFSRSSSPLQSSRRWLHWATCTVSGYTKLSDGLRMLMLKLDTSATPFAKMEWWNTTLTSIAIPLFMKVSSMHIASIPGSTSVSNLSTVPTGYPEHWFLHKFVIVIHMCMLIPIQYLYHISNFTTLPIVHSSGVTIFSRHYFESSIPTWWVDQWVMWSNQNLVHIPVV